MKKPTCKTCAYWEVSKRDPNPDCVGYCHKLPPLWETMRGSDWCGEHPDDVYWRAHQKGTLRWVLWEALNGFPLYYFSRLMGENQPISARSPLEAKLFMTQEEVQDTLAMVKAYYMDDDARFQVAPVILNLEEGTWRA